MTVSQVDRTRALATVRAALRRNPVVALLGPRQCGKTTLARQLLNPDAANYFDLEDPASLARLDQPITALAPLKGLVVIDEVQRRPDLFPVLRVLADRRPTRARFLLLGSAAPALLRQTSESLAGRVETVALSGLTLDDVGTDAMARHWRRGGFPRAWLPRAEADSVRWRRQFLQTVLERDLPQLGIRIPSGTLQRFWTMVAHYHGNIWNAAEPARSLGISQPTVRTYLDILTDLFFVRQLQPWHANLLKRQVKSPKIYIRDSGLLHALLGIRTESELLTHPLLGASWEGYIIEQVLQVADTDDAYFWATHGGAELDLLLFRNGRRYGVEVKRSDAPTLTTSMRIAMDDLQLDYLTVIYPGTRPYALAPNIHVVPAQELAGRGRGAVMPLPSRARRLVDAPSRV